MFALHKERSGPSNYDSLQGLLVVVLIFVVLPEPVHCLVAVVVVLDGEPIALPGELVIFEVLRDKPAVVHQGGRKLDRERIDVLRREECDVELIEGFGVVSLHVLFLAASLVVADPLTLVLLVLILG